MTGPLADRFGKRFPLTVGIGLMGIGLGVMGAAPSYGVILAGAVLGGVGGGLMAALNPLVVELYPHTPSAHLTAVQVSYCVGLIMIGLSGFFIAGSGGWRLPFVVCAPLLTIGSVPFFLGRYPPPAMVHGRLTGFGAPSGLSCFGRVCLRFS